MSENLDELETTAEITIEQILLDLLDPENIELKTEIANPVAFSVFEVMSEFFSKQYDKEVGKLTKSFIDHNRINWVSHNRESRKEVIQALANLEEKEAIKGRMDRLLGDLRR